MTHKASLYTLLFFLILIMGAVSGVKGNSGGDLSSRQAFSFSVTSDMRSFCGPGTYDTPFYFRGVCEAIAAIGGGAFMLAPGDIDPPWDVDWTIKQYIGSDYLWYPILGNHETETPEDMVWIRAVNPDGNNLPYIVNMGPDSTKETNYSFDYGPAHFVVLNEYWDGISDVGTDGNVIDDLYDWLDADLSATTKPIKFVTGHEPAFVQPDVDNGRLRHVGDSLDQYPEQRDLFWSLLVTHEVVAYICGHTHNFSYVLIDGVWQIDAGHARGVGDTGAASVFCMFYVDDGIVNFDAYRDNYNGGPYSLRHSAVLYGTISPTPTPSFTPGPPTATYTPAPPTATFTPEPPTSTPICALNTVLGASEQWRYLDDGSDQGTAWQAEEFDDSGWNSGIAELGFGDGDEATIVSYGPDPNNKYITTYFRKSFQLDDPAGYEIFELRILRDDGAVVYLNGQEVYRTNMPTGTINYQTFAVLAIGDEDERVFHSTLLSPALFQAGVNVLAVEIHQINLTSSDLSFDLRLFNCPITATPTSPPIATFTPLDTPTMTPTPTTHKVNLITEGSTWKYLDNGVDQGTGWVNPAFDDSSWNSGAAQLGYGDGDEITILNYGSDPANKYPTYYFRHVFTVTDLWLCQLLNFHILRDDGVVVYLNGVEILRSNMPEGAVSYSTYALIAIADEEETIFNPVTITPELLLEGENVLAVEIHQVNAYSSDVSFDLKLNGIFAYPPSTPSPIPSPTPEITSTPICLNTGDVIANTKLTAGDAQLAFAIAIGSYSPTYVEACAADCTGDESVTAGDAQSIFYATLGLAQCVDPIGGR